MSTTTLRSLFGMVMFGSLLPSWGQEPIEKVIVETYHVEKSTDGSAPLTTYRVFLDLAPDHALQLLYGDDRHSLRFETTTYFHNIAKGSVKFGDRLRVDPTSIASVASDSWLTIGMVGENHVGIPRELDTDGSMLECAPITSIVAPEKDAPVLDPLCIADGLMVAEGSREVVNYLLEPSYLGELKGSVFETDNGAWAMLGGINGPTKDNVVLVAQFVTTGKLHFVLNAQVGKPDGSYVKIVAKDPKDGELQFDGLTYGVRPVN